MLCAVVGRGRVLIPPSHVTFERLGEPGPKGRHP